MKKSFILHRDSLDILKELTNEQAGVLFKAIVSFQDGVEPELDFAMRIAFLPFRNQFVRDGIKYENILDKRRLAGSKGGKKKVANASKSKQVLANLADSVSDSVSDSDNGSGKKGAPPLDEFMAYYQKELSALFPRRTFAVQAKYEAWVENKWKDGNGEPIKNWKLKLKNTISFLKENMSEMKPPVAASRPNPLLDQDNHSNYADYVAYCTQMNITPDPYKP